MAYWLLVITAVACAVAFWLWRQHVTTSQESRAAQTDDSRKYHCVAIAACKTPCEAVNQLEGKRFLSTDAPVLPLQDCTVASCNCRYIHYEDRREDDRRNPFGRYSSIPPASLDKDRRKKSGRRIMDIVDLEENRISDHF